MIVDHQYNSEIAGAKKKKYTHVEGRETSSEQKSERVSIVSIKMNQLAEEIKASPGDISSEELHVSQPMFG